jgi:energy-converting hydrogenase B subunit D
MQADLVTWIALLVVIVVLVSAVLVLTLENLIGAVAVSGVVSLGVAVLFVLLHAPDVAMTEAAVGAGLSGVVLALGLRRLGLWRLEGTHHVTDHSLAPEHGASEHRPSGHGPSEHGDDRNA